MRLRPILAAVLVSCLVDFDWLMEQLQESRVQFHQHIRQNIPLHADKGCIAASIAIDIWITGNAMKEIKKHLKMAVNGGLLLLLLADTGVGMADVLVKKVHGDSVTVTAATGKARRPVKALNLLKTGERIVVPGKKDYVEVLCDDGKIVRIDSGNSPYPVPGRESTTWLNNALQAALDWYTTLGERQTRAVSLISRGDGFSAISLLGVDRTENLLLKNIPSLRLFWTGGKAPYRVRLYTEDEGLAFDNSVDENMAAIDMKNHNMGTYLMLVESTANGGIILDEQLIQVVGDNMLPQDVQNLDSRILDPQLRIKLMAIMLARYPEWKFYALQLAYAQNDKKLISYIKAGKIAE